MPCHRVVCQKKKSAHACDLFACFAFGRNSRVHTTMDVATLAAATLAAAKKPANPKRATLALILKTARAVVQAGKHLHLCGAYIVRLSFPLAMVGVDALGEWMSASDEDPNALQEDYISRIKLHVTEEEVCAKLRADKCDIRLFSSGTCGWPTHAGVKLTWKEGGGALYREVYLGP